MAGVIECTVGSWTQRAMAIAKQFTTDMIRYGVDVVYIEFPKYMEGGKGHASAVKGDVFKLMFLVGVLSHCCELNNIQFVHIPVEDWKGNLPKEAIAKRVHAAFLWEGKKDMFPNHSMDAVGIGLHLKGFLSRDGEVRRI